MSGIKDIHTLQGLRRKGFVTEREYVSIGNRISKKGNVWSRTLGSLYKKRL